MQMEDFCTAKLKKQLFDFIPSMFNYEEEGDKLVFDILIIDDFSLVAQKMPTFLFHKILTTNQKNLNLKKHIKSIAPFSKNSWNIFISIEKNEFFFGIFKNTNNISPIKLGLMLPTSNFIEISKIDKNIIKFYNNNKLFYLCLSIVKQNIKTNRKNNISNMVKIATNSIENIENKPNFIHNFKNFLFQSLEKIHGTIIVITNSDEKLDNYFNNGIILESPIKLFEEYNSYLQNCSKEDGLVQKYYSLMGMVSIALDIDGIVIMNTKAEMIAYNVFIDNNKNKTDTSIVSGGARKRAAHSIEHSNISGVKGLYFQSHDGDNYFRELKNK